MQQENDIASSAAQATPKCRNCGTIAPGDYCPACGQETRTRLPTFAQFMRDAAGRYVALDGKWWRTLGALIFRPGFLTREYLAGRRRRYIRPSRLFLVASLLVFAVLRLEVEVGGVELIPSGEESTAGSKDRKADVAPDAATDPAAAKAATPKGGAGAARVDDEVDIDLGGAEDAIPGLRARLSRFNQLPSRDRLAQMTDGMLRYGPYAMFALLPVFAALLKILYLGSGRRRPHRPRLYGEHLVFAAHNNAFVAFMVAAAVAIPFPPARAALVTWPFIYLLWAMRVVYGGSWIGTITRAFVLLLSYVTLFGVATAGLVVASVLLR